MVTGQPNNKKTYVLARDVHIVAANTLPPEVRERSKCGLDDYVIYRPRSRNPAAKVTKEYVELLKTFDKPATIPDAVKNYLSRQDLEVTQTFEGSRAFLVLMRRLNYLVEPGAASQESLKFSMTAGSMIDDMEIVRGIRITNDREIYQVRIGAEGEQKVSALKISREECPPRSLERLKREKRVLELLDGELAPRLESYGTYEGRPFLLLSWVEGMGSRKRFKEYRESAGGLDRMLPVGLEILSVYGRLHKRNVVHGDVNGGNILIDDYGRASLLDFEVARVLGDEHSLGPLQRVGHRNFYEPEFARTSLSGQPRALVTPLGEQYSIAALLTFLISGRPYLNLAYEYKIWLRQIIEEEPLHLSELGVKGCEPIGDVLIQALSKKPEDRFDSVASFKDAYEAACKEERNA